MEAFFSQFSDVALNFVNTVNDYLSNYILTILLVGVGIFFTVRTKFVQVRCFGEGMKQVFGKFSMKGGNQEGGMSSFQALTTAIAAQVGTGNIVGACGAILIGGPGAIFWMWIIAFSEWLQFTPRLFWLRKQKLPTRTVKQEAVLFIT